MEQKERESDNIELRSEKVRNVIGKVPPRLVSLGTVVITIIVLALAVAFYNTLNIIYLTLFYPKKRIRIFRKLTIIFDIKLLPHSILALLDLCFLQQGMKA